MSNSQPLANGKIIYGTGWAEGVEYINGRALVSPSSEGERSGRKRGHGGPLCDTPVAEEERRKQNQARALQRARSSCKRKAKELYGRCFGEVYFLTLTYKENMQDRDKAIMDWRNFVLRVRKYGYDMQYISVMEKQKRGAWHFHVLTNIHVDWRIWERLWGHGFINIDKPKGIRHAVRYMVKYLQKTFENEEFKGKHRYFCSQGLTYSVTYKVIDTNDEQTLGTWFMSKEENNKLTLTGYMEFSEEGLRWWEAWEKDYFNRGYHKHD